VRPRGLALLLFALAKSFAELGDLEEHRSEGWGTCGLR